jgi:hypothetical protein
MYNTYDVCILETSSDNTFADPVLDSLVNFTTLTAIGARTRLAASH